LTIIPETDATGMINFFTTFLIACLGEFDRLKFEVL
jgi:hypothetical protein